jgi:hypothetical protein
VRNCKKWKEDGRPKKPTNTECKKGPDNSSKINNTVTLMLESADVLEVNCDKVNWYVDNGATNHITNCKDVFVQYEPFTEEQLVKTANGDTMRAEGKGLINAETIVNGKQRRISLSEFGMFLTSRRICSQYLQVKTKIPQVNSDQQL